MNDGQDGRDQAPSGVDNICKRLWHVATYADAHLHDYDAVVQLDKGLEGYFSNYNHERPHQNLSYQAAARAYFADTDHPELS